MKIKNIVKILMVLLLITLIIATVSPSVFASSASDKAIEAMNKMEGKDLVTTSGTSKMLNILNAVLGLIQIAGTGISMIMVTMLGIKYIMAAPSDKADVKKQITPLVVGAIILFASVNLVSIVADMADTTLKKAAG